MSSSPRLVAATTLLLILSPSLRAQNAGEFRQRFGQWAQQAETLLAAQAKDAEPRASLREWLQGQRDSLGGLAEPLRTTVQPIKMQGSAAFVLDRANEHRATLPAAVHEQLLALGESMLEHCHLAYPKPGNPCRNEKYWSLKAGIAISRAKQADAEPAQRLAALPGLLQRSLDARQTRPAELCDSLWFLMRVQLRPETFAGGKPEAGFFEAYLHTLPALLAPCAGAIQDEPDSLTSSLGRWADAIQETSAALQRPDPAADAAAVRKANRQAAELAAR